MNKLFAALLFFCVVGASVLWWLMKTLPQHPEPSQAAQSTLPTTNVAADDQSEEADSPAAIDGQLRIDTIPSGAKVEIAGVVEGKTPLSVKLREEPTEALISLDGFDEYRRTIPAVKQVEGAELNWKITLRPHSQTANTPSAEEKKPLKNTWLRGSSGPYFIQLKAVQTANADSRAKPNEKSSVEEDLRHFRAELEFEKISGCLVNLGKKGHWHRIIAGPFKTRAEADAKRAEWLTKKPAVAPGFVTGRQNCI